MKFDVKTFQDNLKEKLYDMGADLVGFCRLKTPPIKSDESLIYAVTVAVKLPDSVLKTIENRPTISYFHEYRSANALLDSITFKAARLIEKAGFNGYPIAASQSTADDKDSYKAVFSHKTAGRLSGLGFIGKSGLFVSKEFGSKVRLATILTDMPVEAEYPVIENGCGTCDKCVKNCPAGAISGVIYQEGMCREDFFSADKCSKQMKKFNDVGRGSVCGICIKSCPYNKL